MESGLQAYIEKGWWVESGLVGGVSFGKPCESDVRIDQQEMMKEWGEGLRKVGGAQEKWAGLKKSGRGLRKVGGAQQKWAGLRKSGRGLAKVGGAQEKWAWLMQKIF